MNDFEGLVAVVTGGASGIGAATAAQLRERGATVAVLDRAYEAVSQGSLLEVPCDVADPVSTDTAIDIVGSSLGAIDILINNAGIGAAGDVTQNDDDEWHRVLSVNVIGIARMTRAALPFLLKSSHAAIVNTCSVLADIGVPQRALYCGEQGGCAVADPRDGGRLHQAGHPRERRDARDRGHALGATPAGRGSRR